MRFTSLLLLILEQNTLANTYSTEAEYLDNRHRRHDDSFIHFSCYHSDFPRNMYINTHNKVLRSIFKIGTMMWEMSSLHFILMNKNKLGL